MNSQEQTPTTSSLGETTTEAQPHLDEDITEEEESIPDYQHDPIESFDEMNLSDTLLRGIYNYGFEKPSIIKSRYI